MEWKDIDTEITHQKLIPELNKKFKELIGYDENGNPPEQQMTISELRKEILTILENHKVYDQAGFFLGKPSAGQRIYIFIAVRNFSIPKNFEGSKAYVISTATSDSVFKIKKNGVEIGTITFYAGVNEGVFSTNDAIIGISIGDKIEIVAPDPQDATLSDIAWNLKISYQ